MDVFEELLLSNRRAVERFVRYRIGDIQDADDVLQETYISAYLSFDSLKDKSLFKSWIIGIAKHKCNDYFRIMSKRMEIPTDKLNESMMTSDEHGRKIVSVVHETLDSLGDKDKQILYLYYFDQLPQSEIAKKLSVPLGTVKSRLYTAKQNFKRVYPFHIEERGDNTSMKEHKMPELIPEYKITRSKEVPFEVRWEEIMGWLIVPRLGEKLTWSAYDFPERRRTETCEMEVVGEAEVHGIRGVEITAVEYDPMDANQTNGRNTVERRFVAQLTETHCRYLAESHYENGVKKIYTYLDGDDFLPNWGYGDDNCGKEVNIKQKGIIRLENGSITTEDADPSLDIVGRYNISVNGKEYDTDCVVDLGSYEDGVVSVQYIDHNGKTILWRRFNRDDWEFGRYKMKWTEMYPDNERLTVNGQIYVHWYDCISDYIL